MTALCRWVVVLAVVAVGLPVAYAADVDARPVRTSHAHYRGYLPPERHVIEVVRGAYGSSFVINGASFRAKFACKGWLAGDRIRLLAGSWHAVCVDAVFYNATRHRRCAMTCG